MSPNFSLAPRCTSAYRWTARILLSIIVLALAACSKPQPHDALVGAYLAKEKDAWVVMAKIVKVQREYFIKYKKNTWSKNALRAKPVMPEQFAKISTDRNVKFLGLQSEQIAIIQVPVGTQIGKQKTETGYWLITHEGPVALKRQTK